MSLISKIIIKLIKNSYIFNQLKALIIRHHYKTKQGKSINNIFKDIFTTNEWKSEESVSGTGSKLRQTEAIRKALPDLIHKYKIKTFLDVPCGDFNWMRLIDFGVVKYIGGDIVEDIISKNKELYVSENKLFRLMDLTKDILPESDILFCRDCLVHLSYADIAKVISNLKKSKVQYLLTTTFTERKWNIDIPTGAWRPINLQRKPFSFPEAILIINEQYSGKKLKNSDKSLALWRVSEIPELIG